MNYVSNVIRSAGDPKVLSTGPGSLSAADQPGRALGWFSIGLGLAALLAPRTITRTLGMQGRETLVRAHGAREIGSGSLQGLAKARGAAASRLDGTSGQHSTA